MHKTPKEEVIKELRNEKLYLKNVLNYVEDAFNICCRKKLSINEKYPDSKYKGQLGQKTVFITVKMFDLWETAIVDTLINNVFIAEVQILLRMETEKQKSE
jgi:hypothetical protein